MKNILLHIINKINHSHLLKQKVLISTIVDRYWINITLKILLTLFFMMATLFLSRNMGLGQSNPQRIFFGLLYLGIFPGDSLLCMLFPRKDSINILERFVLMILISIGIITLIGFLLNYTVWGIRLESLLFTTEIVTSMFYIISILRDRRILRNKNNTISERDVNIGKESTNGNMKIQIITLITSIVSAALLLLLIIGAGTKEKYTEFFFLDNNYHLGIEQNNYVVGEALPLNFVVINHEGTAQMYHILLIQNDGEISIIANLSLDDQKQWNRVFKLNLTKLGENQIYKFVLFREGDSEPYRTLQIVISVKDNIK